jgi:hypothetical protein
MDENWKELAPSEQIDVLRRDMDGMLQAMASMQNDLTGLMRRVVEMQAQLNSTYGLVHEVVTTVEKIETRA